MTNGINVFVGKEHITVNSELTFNVRDHSAHLVLILRKLLLDQIEEQNLTLDPGSYRLSFTLCASTSNSVVEETYEDSSSEDPDVSSDNEVPSTEDQ